jgi:hypothetical protein
MSVSTEALNSFDADTRRNTLSALASSRSAATAAPHRHHFNLHCHTFYSFNGYGYSPSMLAWKGAEEGLYAMGIVDFDTLDGVDEFLEAAYGLGLRACAGLETRIYIPEFADRVINSPGEPGISYHMGIGFPHGLAPAGTLLERLQQTSADRNRDMIARVNKHLLPAELDYEMDVLPLTPNGNATERHICQAYMDKGIEVYPNEDIRSAFWADRLDTDFDEVEALQQDRPAFQNLIRAKTMKAGGVGYVQPDAGAFPRLEEVNQFTLSQGAIPCMTWLDGLSDGEKAMDELMDLMEASGVEAVNIIPDRNWNLKDPETKTKKMEALYDFVGRANKRHLPIIVGTEMNAHGQRFVDDFDASELEPCYESFLRGAHILHGHTLLQRAAAIGYTSDWAKQQFDDRAAKNVFYATIGERVRRPDNLPEVDPGTEPGKILEALKR